MKAYLLLEDGDLFQGESFGADVESIGEVVFNTGLTGYQEILTDPSYCGQIVNMTYPLIGNYGVNRDDFESIKPFVSGFVVREYCQLPSNWRSTKSFDQLLKDFNIPGLHGIDTRRLTRKIRKHGCMRAAICQEGYNEQVILKELQKELPRNQVEQVSTKDVVHTPGLGPRICVIDYGCKRGILRELMRRSCEVILLPYNVTAQEVLGYEPDAVLLSNGPGDPRDVPEAQKTIEGLVGKVPIMGICLGHQLLSLYFGAEVEKMKFGHHGTNQPVKDLSNSKVYISSQNHGYAIREKSMQNLDMELTHIAVNDNTVEGMKHKEHKIFSVQYHPEAAPGPNDNSYLFDEFLAPLAAKRKRSHHAY